MYLSPGTHMIDKAITAEVSAAILHFKYFRNFYAAVKEEVKRKEHWDNASEYKAYAKILDRSDLYFYYGKSARFSGSQQLIDLGIMQDSKALQDYAGEK